MTRMVKAHGKLIEVEDIDMGLKPSRRRRREADLFIMVPLGRAAEVHRAVGSAQAFVWELLLHAAWLAKSSSFTCPNGLMKRFGISRQAKYRALDGLEAAGFITVERQPAGRAPIVTLI